MNYRCIRGNTVHNYGAALKNTSQRPNLFKAQRFKYLNSKTW